MTEVLALKYRPKIFEEVVGQDQTVNQLRSALENGTLGHALLFCGTRGTGKTSTARILAHELNRDVPEIYDRWEERQHLVLMEIDAASHTGIDNVRDLNEKIQYAVPGHRVVILDEAHMMSKAAFNALLKTLEEPPPEVTFVLVTTEPHKLIDTVRSRCQIYEFYEVPALTLESYFEHIMELEGIKANAAAIALRANGSVRDGLSLLQKALSGEAPEDNAKQYFELVGAIYSQDVATALGMVSELRKVEDARIIIQTLERWFYWCSLECFGQRTPVRQFFGGSEKLDFDLAYLQRLFDACLEVEQNFAATPNAKIVLEMGIMKLCL